MDKKTEHTNAGWKNMFRFTKDGALQSVDLMYAFFLGLGVLFLNFLLSNQLTFAVESLFPDLPRMGKNILAIIIPIIPCALITMLLFRVIRKKRIVTMAYYFAFLLVLIVSVIILFELDAETKETLLPAFAGIFLAPAAVCAITASLLFRNRQGNETAEIPTQDEEAEQTPEDGNTAKEEEPDYSGWRQFRF